MGYEVPVARPSGPTVVSAAVVCLFVLAAVQIINAFVTLVSFGPAIDAARDYAGGTTEGDAFVTAQQIGRYAGSAIALLFAIGFAVLGLFTNRGKNAARIVSWVVLGIGLCCNAGGLASIALGGVLTGGSSGGAVDMEELQRRTTDAIPGWATATSYSLLTISILAALAAIILLALPASNEYFRKVEPVWEPPVPGAAYPVPGEPTDAVPPGYPGGPEDPNRPGGGFAPPGP
jgi:hypothetical protein